MEMKAPPNGAESVECVDESDRGCNKFNMISIAAVHTFTVCFLFRYVQPPLWLSEMRRRTCGCRIESRIAIPRHHVLQYLQYN